MLLFTILGNKSNYANPGVCLRKCDPYPRTIPCLTCLQMFFFFSGPSCQSAIKFVDSLYLIHFNMTNPDKMCHFCFLLILDFVKCCNILTFDFVKCFFDFVM